MKPFNQLQAGDKLFGDRYEIMSCLGHGRTASVYRATDTRTRAQVALKVLNPFLALNARSLERFKREAIILRELNFENVIKVFSLEHEDNLYAISMEYFEAKDLKQKIQSEGAIRFDWALEIIKQICTAIAECHKRGVLHRDLKPQNILIDSKRKIRVLDFGVSKLSAMSDLTKTGTAMGTPEYMAPELFQSARADARSDVYSLGCIAYEIVMGHPAFSGNSLAAMMAEKIKEDTPDPHLENPQIPEWFGSIIRKSLAKNPLDRYQTCDELLLDLVRQTKALSLIESNSQRSKCLSCKNELTPGISFCHSCGKLADEAIEKGNFALIAYRCEDIPNTLAYIKRNFPEVDISWAENRLKNPPALILSKVSEGTASNISSDLSAFPIELKVATRLPTTLRLPQIFPVLAIAASLSCVLLKSPVLIASGIALIQTMLYLGYRQKVRPIYRLKDISSRKESPLQNRLNELFSKIRSLPELRIRALCCNIVAAYKKVRGDSNLKLNAEHVRLIDENMENALATAKQLCEFEIYLAAKTVNSFQEKLRAIDVRMKHSKSTKDTEVLVKNKISVQQEFDHYQDIQEAHSKAYLSMLNYLAVLKRMEVADPNAMSAPVQWPSLESSKQAA